MRIILVTTFLFFLINFTSAQCNCGTLPSPGNDETVVYVNTSQELQDAINNAVGPTTIFLNSGIYPVSSTMFINVFKPDITIRSTTGNRDDVIFEGEGMDGPGIGNGITISEDNITIADLTVRNVANHAFFVHPGADSCLFHNVRGLDCGEQIFKASGDETLEPKNNGIIECSTFEYTTTLNDNDDGWYTNGIDLLYCQNWIIRDNIIKNIKHNPSLTSNLAGPAILAWYESSNTIIERNRIIECDFGISLGNAGQGGISHTGGIVKNNFIVGYENSDFGIGLAYAPNAKIINNTIYSPGAWPYSIEARFAETNNCVIMNNLCDEDIWDNRDSASCTLTTNITTASSSDFVDVGTGDLHLLSSNVNAIDAGTVSADRTIDIDCGSIISGTDIGADEYNSINSIDSDKIAHDDIIIFPNPSRGVLNIKGNKIEKIEIYNSTGQTVYICNNCHSNNVIRISNHIPGLYFVKVTMAKHNYLKNLIFI